MTKKIHRALTAILASLTGVSALLAATDSSSLDVTSTTWAWTALVLSVGTVVVTAVRQAADPDSE